MPPLPLRRGGGRLSEEASVGERVRAIRRRIADACVAAGRDPADVTLVAASKSQPPARLLAAWEAGVRCCGENRVQEAAGKRAALPAAVVAGLDWHLLGPLQSNKARQAVGLFSTFHGLDRAKIFHALAAEAERTGAVCRAFAEVNLGGEASKHGFAPQGLGAVLGPLRALPRLELVGLMAIPPPEEDPAAARRWFAMLRGLRDELQALPGWAGFPGLLSMGMSDDFELAIAEGATHVRVGTALFGPRQAAA